MTSFYEVVDDILVPVSITGCTSKGYQQMPLLVAYFPVLSALLYRVAEGLDYVQYHLFLFRPGSFSHATTLYFRFLRGTTFFLVGFLMRTSI